MKKLSLIIAVVLTGCCQTTTVMKPVPVCPAPDIVMVPPLLTVTADPRDTSATLRAMAVDIIRLKSALHQNINTLEVYRNLPHNLEEGLVRMKETSK